MDSDWRMVAAFGFTITQQVLLALSTYYIAQAGLALGDGRVEQVFVFVTLFFLLALLGYVASSAASLFTNLASNAAWHRYSFSTLVKSTASLRYASDKNRKAISQWLGGEALSTLGYACEFYIGFVSVSLNVALTLLVFYISIGWQIALVMAASLTVSLLFVIVLRHRIERSAGEMQRRKLEALLTVEWTWGLAMFGSRAMRQQGFSELDDKTGRYFAEVNRYVALEQAVACLPIIVATVSVMLLLEYSSLFTLASMGALVAVLPRSLQVFGSVHALSIYLSQFYLVRAKLRNLEAFSSTLDDYNMSLTSLQAVSVCETDSTRIILPLALIQRLSSPEIGGGRYTVTGKNGSGKSTFLKLIKQGLPDALLMTPDAKFSGKGEGLSTGQLRIQEVENALSSGAPILLLDEWDANLDEDNSNAIDSLLDKAAKQIIIVEVRHVRQGRAVSSL
ncbi:hypothetical protein [Pseudomonas sp. MYb118]|uniref:hypothetical protein n=1 Tax=Pseudomonas sp. MYb118 TaxID=1848720 RepID=UPI0034CF4500